jgi:hypothetical protein
MRGPLVGIGVVVVLLLSVLQPSDAQTRNPLRGEHANAWSAAVVGVSGTSAALDCAGQPFASAFGNTSAAATLTVQMSDNGTNWYSSSVNTGAVTGDFGINFTVGARRLRLISNAAATITATLQCKSGG